MVSLGWDGDWEIVVVVIVTKGYERERSTQHQGMFFDELP